MTLGRSDIIRHHGSTYNQGRDNCGHITLENGDVVLLITETGHEYDNGGLETLSPHSVSIRGYHRMARRPAVKRASRSKPLAQIQRSTCGRDPKRLRLNLPTKAP